MKVILPLQITEAMVTSSTISEPSGTDPSIWVSNSNYAVGSTVYRNTTHKVYECISEVTASTTAATQVPEVNIFTATPSWVEVDSTNKYRMFDFMRNTTSKLAGTITVVLNPVFRIDSLALLGLVNVTNIYVEILDSSLASVFSYNAANTLTDKIFFDLPPYYNTTITITLTGTGTLEISNCLIGLAQYLGITQNQALSDTINFSSVNRDAFGTATITRRRNVPKLNVTLFTDKLLVNRLLDVRDQLNAVPALWCGLSRSDSTDDLYDTHLIMGIYRTFSISIDNPIGAVVTLELEEL